MKPGARGSRELQAVGVLKSDTFHAGGTRAVKRGETISNTGIETRLRNGTTH